VAVRFRVLYRVRMKLVLYLWQRAAAGHALSEISSSKQDDTLQIRFLKMRKLMR
jgi:hypothetical protein